MLANRRRDTGPEMRVRRLLYAAGLRYRVDYPIPAFNRRRRADIVFPRLRITIFIDGCFWHGCPDHFAAPKSHVHYGEPKIARTQERDLETTTQLRAAGWEVMRFWEHEAPTAVAERVLARIRQGPL